MVLDEPISGRGTARLMQEITGALADSAVAGMREAHSLLTRFGGELRNAGRAATNADAAGLVRVNEISTRGPWLAGWDARNQRYTFEPHQIRARPLVNHRGEVFGVSFPTKNGGPGPSDVEAYSTWSRMPNRASDTEFVPQVRIPGTRAGAPLFRDSGPALRAPWADDTGGGVLYTHAHATRRGFEVDANIGSDAEPDWRTLLVPGRFFGHVLASNRYFVTASRSAPDRPLVMLCCDAGDPRYGHARDAATVLHQEGMRHDVYATTGINQVRWDRENGLAEVLVETPPNSAPQDSIVAFPAVPRGHDP
ncbi:hypothetical protein [Nocardia sp. NPDC003345]